MLAVAESVLVLVPALLIAGAFYAGVTVGFWIHADQAERQLAAILRSSSARTYASKQARRSGV
ncbi:MAG: hypothetical protein QMD96_01945 [Anaerosomatales bacterium]|nr:hypothetical protein [Anaerosomatales bacterium]